TIKLRPVLAESRASFANPRLDPHSVRGTSPPVITTMRKAGIHRITTHPFVWRTLMEMASLTYADAAVAEFLVLSTRARGASALISNGAPTSLTRTDGISLRTLQPLCL